LLHSELLPHLAATAAGWHAWIAKRQAASGLALYSRKRATQDCPLTRMDACCAGAWRKLSPTMRSSKSFSGPFIDDAEVGLDIRQASRGSATPCWSKNEVNPGTELPYADYGPAASRTACAWSTWGGSQRAVSMLQPSVGPCRLDDCTAAFDIASSESSPQGSNSELHTSQQRMVLCHFCVRTSVAAHSMLESTAPKPSIHRSSLWGAHRRQAGRALAYPVRSTSPGVAEAPISITLRPHPGSERSAPSAPGSWPRLPTAPCARC
jgi:hypothetical protein